MGIFKTAMVAKAGRSLLSRVGGGAGARRSTGTSRRGSARGGTLQRMIRGAVQGARRSA